MRANLTYSVDCLENSVSNPELPVTTNYPFTTAIKIKIGLKKSKINTTL